jgi:hypothetical protein
MPYWTQGVVTLHAVSKKISITPTADYEVNHDRLKYTIFMETPTRNKTKFFLNGHLFRKDARSPGRRGTGQRVCPPGWVKRLNLRNPHGTGQLGAHEAVARLLRGKRAIPPEQQAVMEQRLAIFSRLRPTHFIEGTSGFVRYFGAKYADVSENLR